MGTYVGTRESHVDVEPAVRHRARRRLGPDDWDLDDHLPLQPDAELRHGTEPPADRRRADLDRRLERLRRLAPCAPASTSFPGFPVWVDAFVHEADLLIEDGTPDWKANFLRKNAEFYTKHHDVLEEWLERWDYLRDFPASRRKFEWQAQHARPSTRR